MGLQQNIQKQLRVPIGNILANSTLTENGSKMSITDIFDAHKLLRIALNFYPQNIPIQAAFKNKERVTYQQIYQLLKQGCIIIGLEINRDQLLSQSFLAKEKIEFEDQVIDSLTWHNLRALCNILFQILLRNEKVLNVITVMEEKYQIQIKQYIQNNCDYSSLQQAQSPGFKVHSRNFIPSSDHLLIEKVAELEQALSNKDQQASQAKIKIDQLKQESQILRHQLQKREGIINSLKKRMQAYNEIDILLQQKDEEIQKLNKQLTDLKLQSYMTSLKNTQQVSQIARLESMINQFGQQRLDLSRMNQELSRQLKSTVSNKDEMEATNKKVIANLKDKIKTLNQRLDQQQKSMIDLLNQKEQKFKDSFDQKKSFSFDNLRKGKKQEESEKGSKLGDELGDISISSQNENESKKYYSVLFGESPRCTGQLCIALRSEYVRYFQQILRINRDQSSLEYTTPRNRLDCMLNQLTKIQQTQQQNLKLKQKIVLLQTENKGQSNKQSTEQINKLKKKLLIMKRNIEDVENRRKQQIQILISAFGEKFAL